VHRLSNLGAVWTHAVSGTSQDGFDAEWREICLATVEGDLINRIEMFEDEDLDAALARFDELSRPAPRLDNAASRTYDRFNACLAARDWDAMAELIADDACNDDRRRVVSGGIQRGRDAQIANLRAVIDVGVRNMESVVIATRGERLALTRTRVSGGDQRPDAFGVELLNITEIDTDNRISAGVLFDLNDINAAFAELDARYLAGEAASHSQTWSVIAQGYAAANRGEIAATVPDLVNIDNRQLAMIESGELVPYLRDTFDELANFSTYVEAVHRLTDLGVVVTHVGAGTSKEGFDAEWRMINVVVVDGDLISRSEMFDEVDIDAAVARFDELSLPAPQLENAASRVDDRFEAYFAARDWDAMAELMTEDISIDDRRSVVNAGLVRGRSIEITSLRAIADLGVRNVTSDVIATRGQSLAVSRNRFMGRDQRPEAFHSETICIIEIDTDERIVARVTFDIDDINAAFAELDARFLAGEAAPHAHTWSVVGGSFAAVNRHELPELTPDWVNIDHRRAVAVAPGDMTAYIEATLDDAPTFRVYIEAVHRLTDLGAVVTQASGATSHQRFDAEWRMISISTVEGDMISRGELFDEADIDTALARFDELNRPAP
jgi:hypothetical protein